MEKYKTSKGEEQKLNENKSKTKFDDIKSNYIFKIIFNFLHKKKLLEINKYNKKSQKRLNLTLNNYKEGSRIFSSIEIEIKPVKGLYGEFINISKEEEIYYHIYFNNSKVEQKKYEIKEEDKVTKIKIKIDYQITSFERLFNNCKIIESIFFTKFYRKNIIDMSWMFVGCSSLKELSLSNVITENVTNMSRMFLGCRGLEEINISNFNTTNVTDMCFMFSGCASLKEINVSNFNVNNVIDMSGMFFDCTFLEKIYLFDIIPKKTKDMSYMFAKCYSLNDLKFNKFIKQNQNINNREIFSECSKTLINKIKNNYNNFL